MSIGTGQHASKPKLPMGIEPRMLSFDVYGTLINTPPANLQALRSILHEASETNVDPMEFYSFWEQRNVAHYMEPYRSYKEICQLSLSEAFRRFGVSSGREELIARYRRVPARTCRPAHLTAPRARRSLGCPLADEPGSGLLPKVHTHGAGSNIGLPRGRGPPGRTPANTDRDVYRSCRLHRHLRTAGRSHRAAARRISRGGLGSSPRSRRDNRQVHWRRGNGVLGRTSAQ